MKFRKLAAVLMAALLTLTVFAVPAFADETVTVESEAAEESVAIDAASEEDVANDVADEELLTTTADDSTATETAEETDTDTEKSLNWDAIIAGGIVLVALIVLVILYCVNKKFNERVRKFCRDYLSELKKIVWSPMRDVKKNTVITIVLSLFFAIMIGLLDVIFSEGIQALGPVVSSLLK